MEGAASTAAIFAVRPVIVGLTIVSLATSAPELLVSLMAAFKGSEGISLGNILGSNVINIALVLGLSAAIKPVSVQSQVVKIEIPYMIAVSTLFWVLCMDNHLGRLDGIVLLLMLAIFLVYGFCTAKDATDHAEASPSPDKTNFLRNIIYMAGGVVLLAAGAHYVVKEAIYIARYFGLSETFIGISVVALGTSLPELATSAVAAARGESDISVGNVVGSNLFNICLVMGTLGLLNPMDTAPDLHRFQFPFMVFIAFLLGGMGWLQRGVHRKGGWILMVMFVVYISVSYIN